MAAERFPNRVVARPKFIYAPKAGDEIKWPNGLTMTWSEDADVLIVTGVPEDDTLTVDSLDGTWMIEVVQ